MPIKGKLPAEEKIKIVINYLSGFMGAKEICAQHGIDKQTLRRWVQRYETRGASGLTSSKQNRRYEPKTKQAAVCAYLNGEGSLKDVCRKYDISDDRMLRQWVKLYNSQKGFKQPNSGGATYMAKSRSTTLEERIKIVSHCIANNKDYGKTSEEFKVSYQQIYGWVRKYEQQGAEGLSDNRGRRKDTGAMTEIEKLNAQLKLKEAENTRLRMENELLKKLDALERGIDQD